MHRLRRLDLLELKNCRSLRGWNGVIRLSADVEFLSLQIHTSSDGACIPPEVEDTYIHIFLMIEFPGFSNF